MPPKRNQRSNEFVTSSSENESDTNSSNKNESSGSKTMYKGIYVGISRKTFHVMISNFPNSRAPTRETFFEPLSTLQNSHMLVVSYGSKATPDSNQIELYQRFGMKFKPKEYLQFLESLVNTMNSCQFVVYITKKEEAALNSVSRADYDLLHMGVTDNFFS